MPAPWFSVSPTELLLAMDSARGVFSGVEHMAFSVAFACLAPRLSNKACSKKWKAKGKAPADAADAPTNS